MLTTKNVLYRDSLISNFPYLTIQNQPLKAALEKRRSGVQNCH